MAGTKEIRSKIKSVQNTRKITKAMEMVAASKMRRAQERMRSARPYSEKVREIVSHLADANPEYRPIYMNVREVNAAGVMPIIFAQAIMFIPSTFLTFFPDSDNAFLQMLQKNFTYTSFTYSIIFAILIVFFTYFYTAIVFNPKDVADNMQKQGGFIPGIRPGKHTSDFIDNVLTRITLPGSIFLAVIAILPAFMVRIGVTSQFASFFGGTSLLIAVGVALDTLQQIESHLLMRHYDGFMKGGRIKGRRT